MNSRRREPYVNSSKQPCGWTRQPLTIETVVGKGNAVREGRPRGGGLPETRPRSGRSPTYAVLPDQTLTVEALKISSIECPSDLSKSASDIW
jgi:hypothetical protein